MTAATRVMLGIAAVFVLLIGIVLLTPRVIYSDCEVVQKQVLIRWANSMTSNKKTVAEIDIVDQIRTLVRERVDQTGVTESPQVQTPKAKDSIPESPRIKIAIQQFKADLARIQNWNQLPQPAKDLAILTLLDLKSNKGIINLTTHEQNCVNQINFALRMNFEIPR